jgi:GNAT superfamily N-acetyltransferase
MQTAIRLCTREETGAVLAIINDAAQAYKDVIPPDRWHDPYMTAVELRTEIAQGVVFWGALRASELIGVAGLQDQGDVVLVRHAYVATDAQRHGCGSALLRHLERRVDDKPILIGTWADARWAIDFYRKAGYTLVPTARKNALLEQYWTIPPRQVATSVVLAKRLPASA